jgi:hypothetical protein
MENYATTWQQCKTGVALTALGFTGGGKVVGIGVRTAEGLAAAEAEGAWAGTLAGTATKTAAESGGDLSKILMRSPRQLQAKFKHAADFGVEGNYSRANAAKFSEAINQHINAAGTEAIQGTYRGQAVTHHLDPTTGLDVISRSGEFVSGWRLSPGQLANVLRNGSLGGG